MNDNVTILGRVGADPNRSVTTTGVPVVNFRVASPQRRYDSKSQTWIETGTNWYNISAFRQLAEHTKASLRQGDGVIIIGRLKLREWESGGRKGMSADIDAETIGHDLRWGASAYMKASSTSSTAQSAPASHSLSPAEAPNDDEQRVGTDMTDSADDDMTDSADDASPDQEDTTADYEAGRSGSGLAFSTSSWSAGQ